MVVLFLSTGPRGSRFHMSTKFIVTTTHPLIIRRLFRSNCTTIRVFHINRLGIEKFTKIV